MMTDARIHPAIDQSRPGSTIHRSKPAIRRPELAIPMSIPEIGPREFLARLGAGESLTLLDVREDWELEVASVPPDAAKVLHIPMGQVAQRVDEIDQSREVIVLCRSGRRSLEVAKFLQQSGYRTANLTGGILAWSRDVDATIPTY
jgi:adenylyltransferase/sulfurtransferase